jgi:hypothetical protein
MYKESSTFNTPADERTIWRYMNFATFVSVLHYSSPYFPTAKKLADSDPFEGSFARGNLEYNLDGDPSINQEQIKSSNQARKFFRQFTKDSLRKVVCINSWYLNEHESAAMWQCYAPHKEGIAIQSTIGRLKEAIQNDPKEISIGAISYIDHQNAQIPENTAVSPFLYKGKSFEHEREVRAICFDKETIFDRNAWSSNAIITSPNGVEVIINLDVLIERIVISPLASHWITKLVKDVTHKYGLKKTIKKSSLYEDGLW